MKHRQDRIAAPFAAFALFALLLGTACEDAAPVGVASAASISGSVELDPDPWAPGKSEDGTGEAKESARRNVVLITIDTLRADALGAHGRNPSPSPRIDQLAASAVLFEQCSASAPSTLPSHASILTGKYPYQHGARSNGSFALSHENVTLAERLRDAGFATGAEVASIVLAKRSQIDQGFEHYRDPNSPDAAAGRQGGNEKERSAVEVTRRGIEFVRKHHRGPFFLWLHYFDVHAPYAPPEPHATAFRRSPYHGAVAAVDEQVGRFTDELVRIGLARNTLVIITSDHGEALGEHGEETHLFYVHETTIRVPLIVWGPQELPTRLRVETPVRTVDIAPTVVDWLGLEPLHGVAGASLLPLMSKARTHDFTDRLAYGESIGLRTLFGGSTLRFVREGSWKYIHKQRPELYNLADDPAELRDLAAEEPERLARLRSRLRDLLSDAPAAAPDSMIGIDDVTAQQLENLGYLAVSPGSVSGGEVFEVDGVDPMDLVDDVKRFRKASEYLGAGRAERGLALYRELAKQHPSSAGVLEGVVNALILLKREDELVTTLPQLIELNPWHLPYRRRLLRLNQKRGEDEAVEQTLRAIVERWPCDVDGRMRLANRAALSGDPREQARLLEEGIAACDAPVELRNDLAWVLATSTEDGLRDGVRSLELAKGVAAAFDPPHPFVLDTLAAAYAENGRFGEAVEVSRRAVRLARTQKLPASAVKTLRDHLASFESEQPVRE